MHLEGALRRYDLEVRLDETDLHATGAATNRLLEVDRS
jgi:hypothetical protein